MRDTVMTDREIAILSAKENLSSLAKRPGYAEAMREPAPRWTATLVCSLASIAFAILTYATWNAIDGTVLRWIVVLFFGLLAGFAALLALGASPNVDRDLRWAVAIIEKHDEPNQNKELTILREDGTELKCPVDDKVHAAVRVGDFGVAIVEQREPHAIGSFTRL